MVNVVSEFGRIGTNEERYFLGAGNLKARATSC